METLQNVLALALARPREGALVRYGSPGSGRGGPLAKLSILKRYLPEHRLRFNVLYLLSAGRPDLGLIARARDRGVKVVLSQDGVYYPAVRPDDWQAANEPICSMLSVADYVLYQSEYARVAADKFAVRAAGEVLHNAVDTNLFVPGRRREGKREVLLLTTGLITNELRLTLFEQLLTALAALKRMRGGWRLKVATRFDTPEEDFGGRVRELVRRQGLEDRVVLSGAYGRSEAVSVYQGADIYLHNMYNDCCPNSVLEAMSCGLPVVYSASGGTPELVADEGGIGVPCAVDWDTVHAPAPEAYAAAIGAVMDRWDEYRRGARERAVARFDVAKWIERHRAVFGRLLAAGAQQ